VGTGNIFNIVKTGHESNTNAVQDNNKRNSTLRLQERERERERERQTK